MNRIVLRLVGFVFGVGERIDPAGVGAYGDGRNGGYDVIDITRAAAVDVAIVVADDYDREIGGWGWMGGDGGDGGGAGR